MEASDQIQFITDQAKRRAVSAASFDFIREAFGTEQAKAFYADHALDNLTDTPTDTFQRYLKARGLFAAHDHAKGLYLISKDRDKLPAGMRTLP